MPTRSDGVLRLRDSQSGLSVEATLLDARPAPAEVVEGYVVYRDGGPGQSTLLHRPTPDGTEDYFAFEERPDRESVTYDVTLSPEVAGLRLVADTLEFLDPTGDPRLRLAPPYLVDAEGRLVYASLEVGGCEVDTNSAPPWDRAPTPPGALRCRVHIGWKDKAVAYPALLDPWWLGTGDMTYPRYLFPAVKLNDGRVWVSGGYNRNHGAFARAEIFNPATLSWTTTANLPVRRARHTATLLDDGRVLVAGGFNLRGTPVRASYLFDPATGTYQSAGNMIEARAQHTATRLDDGRVLVAGGIGSSGGAQATANLYTPGSGWSSTGGMIGPQADHRAIKLIGGDVLVVGANGPSAQRYVPAWGVWRPTAELAVPRAAGALNFLLDGRVVYSGGYQPLLLDSGTAIVEVYSPSQETWTRSGSLWHERGFHTATLADNGRLYIVGGKFFADEADNNKVERFNPRWGTSTPMPGMEEPRVGHAAVKLDFGAILVMGGSPAWGLTPTNTTALLIPDTTPAVAVGEYKMGPFNDIAVIDGQPIDLWAKVYRPAIMTPGTKHPLILMLHGYKSAHNVLHHLGFEYIAEELAERGYIVVSINATELNRVDLMVNGPAVEEGDSKFIRARGRLVLRHLQWLSWWGEGFLPTPSEVGVDLSGKIDFSQVGLLGHSRGGEAMRAAYTIYNSPSPPVVIPVSVRIRGILELAGSDTTTPHLDAVGTHWAGVMGMCDGDTGSDDMAVFDRMLNTSLFEGLYMKATYTIWGANHGAFNSLWSNEGSECFGAANRPIYNSGNNADPEQLQAALQPVLAFFLAHVGPNPDPSYIDLFDPVAPPVPEPNVDRSYTVKTPLTYVLEDFSEETGRSSSGGTNVASSVGVEHRSVPAHRNLRGARMYWFGGGYFQVNFGNAVNLSLFQNLDMRLARTDLDLTDTVLGTWLNPLAPTTLEVRLVMSDGTLSSPVQIASYTQLDGPVGVHLLGGGIVPATLHVARPLLETARIPFSAFSNATLSSVSGIRFTFGPATSGDIMVSSIRATAP